MNKYKLKAGPRKNLLKKKKEKRIVCFDNVSKKKQIPLNVPSICLVSFSRENVQITYSIIDGAYFPRCKVFNRNIKADKNMF